MLIDFDPVIFSLGPLQVRWYGLMYVLGFLIGAKILFKLAVEGFLQIAPEKADLLMTYVLVGMIIFARSFYVLIYGQEDTHSLIDFIAVWRGGLSFHGAMIGFIVAAMVFSKRQKVPLVQVFDSIAIGCTIGLGLGRIGNFINMELYGRETNVPWGMVFASDPEKLIRHPSQLYQVFVEGIVLTLVLWWVKKKAKIRGMITAAFVISYGILRYIVEFFREADSQMGYYLGGTTTMGQILCLVMVGVGLGFFAYYRSRKIPVDLKPWQTLVPLKAQNKKKRKS